MQVAVVTFDGFNELDSLICAHIVNRVDRPGWRAQITGASRVVTSMNGLVLEVEQPLEYVTEADAVVFGSGRATAAAASDASILDRLSLRPESQLIASQCSGALFLRELGLILDMPICTDSRTAESGLLDGHEVLAQPFHAVGRIATAGGCLAAHYLATWLIWCGAGRQVALDALSYVLPRGEEELYEGRVIRNVESYVTDAATAVATRRAGAGVALRRSSQSRRPAARASRLSDPT